MYPDDTAAVNSATICAGCGQPGGGHLPVCPSLMPVPVAAPAETAAEQAGQHDLGQAT